MFTATPTFAQKTEGAITYKMDMESDDTNPMIKMLLGDAKLVLRFKGKAFRSDLEMSIMDQTTILDADSKEGLILMSLMGTKNAIKIDPADFEKQQHSQADADIELLDEKKKIAGYVCKKAIIRPKGKDVKDATLTLYYTDKIVAQNFANPYTYAGIKGMPLQMEIELQGNFVTMIATEVNLEKQRKDLFKVIVPEGYTVREAGDMKKMFEGQ